MRHFHAPGRVNLIGDHIDYMGGTVLPMAVDRGTDLWARPRADRLIVAESDNFPQAGQIVAEVDGDPPRTEWDWVNYLVAVASVLRRRGIDVPGVDVRVRGSIPNGAGLSSSASIELAMAVAFDAFTAAGLSAAELAVECQRAENSLGIACGIMDQMSIACGRRGHALAINCQTLEVRPVRFPEGLAVVVANTNQRRELSDSAYNERRGACEAAEQLLGRRLVEIDEDGSAEVLSALPSSLRARARHVVTEQARVIAFERALAGGDRAALGALMKASHESLRDDFEVTGLALDAMVEAAWAFPGVVGARMTGAGFGGCTVNLVEPDAVDEFVAFVGPRFTATTGLTPDFYVVTSADGAREVLA